ncbi:hypothetical protein SRDD_29830 [Serratia sp. DD3]|nr:hypothetical protein SRDD_29830 [Serratia sp. DD3]
MQLADKRQQNYAKETETCQINRTMPDKPHNLSKQQKRCPKVSDLRPLIALDTDSQAAKQDATINQPSHGSNPLQLESTWVYTLNHSNCLSLAGYDLYKFESILLIAAPALPLFKEGSCSQTRAPCYSTFILALAAPIGT